MLHVQADDWKILQWSRLEFHQRKDVRKNAKRIKHEEDSTAKVYNLQVEHGVAAMNTKYKRGVAQQKLLSKLSCQDKCHSSVALFLIHSLLNPPFNTFRDE